MTMTGIERDAHDLSQLLANAHRTLDVRGVPHAEPAPSNASLMLARQTPADYPGKPGRKPGPIPHGTRYGYARRGCRCPECVTAERDYQARRRVRLAAAAHRDTNPVADHNDGPCRCTCGYDAPNRTALGRHAWTAHDRPPTDAERVVLAAVAA